MTGLLRKVALPALDLCGASRLFRHLNRHKLLVVMYHGITTTRHDPAVWTQLPVEIFTRQVDFLRSHYRLLTMTEVVQAIRNGTPLPERSALLTFDDGLQNNYRIAFPLLQKLGVPATIFLTVDYVGQKQLLWVDELYLLLCQARDQGITPPLASEAARSHFLAGRLWPAYELTVAELKQSGVAGRTAALTRLRQTIAADRLPWHEDFAMLDWQEVRAMDRSGLVEFGVHTASHRILTELADDEWQCEVVAPREKLAQQLGKEVVTFCFPNGRPVLDFRKEQLARLRSAGYLCAFSTENALFDSGCGNPMSIGRIPAGNDGTSGKSCFALSTAGALQFLRERVRPQQQPVWQELPGCGIVGEI
jgi:peptidoglycan/xylan/chitin deacetylase (PgdA/CDA1 family)